MSDVTYVGGPSTLGRVVASALNAWMKLSWSWGQDGGSCTRRSIRSWKSDSGSAGNTSLRWTPDGASGAVPLEIPQGGIWRNPYVWGLG